MRAFTKPDHRAVTKVQVTPIIDVALVLVIILLVTAPLLAVADLELTLPVADSRGNEDDRRVMVTLSVDGELAVEDELVGGDAALVEALRGCLARDGWGEALVVLRADGEQPHARVRELMDRAREAGAARVALATRQRSGEAS